MVYLIHSLPDLPQGNSTVIWYLPYLLFSPSVTFLPENRNAKVKTCIKLVRDLQEIHFSFSEEAHLE